MERAKASGSLTALSLLAKANQSLNCSKGSELRASLLGIPADRYWL